MEPRIGASVGIRPIAVLAASVLCLAGCGSIATTTLSGFGDPEAVVDVPSNVVPQPDEQLIPVAKAHFREGDYGHAARYYEQAVEVMPDNAEAWLGLAASYDRIRRFDLADNAYRKLASLIGDRPEYYNNVGYSYMLRGDLSEARKYFLKAYELDPDNLTTANNLKMLRDGIRSSGDGGNPGAR